MGMEPQWSGQDQVVLRMGVREEQSNGFIERSHRTFLDEHFRVKGGTLGTRPLRRCRPIWTP